jgi:CDP-diglyceride synthetase
MDFDSAHGVGLSLVGLLNSLRDVLSNFFRVQKIWPNSPKGKIILCLARAGPGGKNPNKYLFFFTHVIFLIVIILGPVQIFSMIQKVFSSPREPLHSLETPLLLLLLLLLLLGNDPAFCHQILTMYLVRCFSIFCFFIISSRDMFNSGLSSNASMFVYVRFAINKIRFFEFNPKLRPEVLIFTVLQSPN